MAISRRHLTILVVGAALSISFLMAISDFGPLAIAGFADIPAGGGRVEMTCAVSDSFEGKRGWILELVDINGATARAFCGNGTISSPPPQGSVVRIVAEVEGDELAFLFIESLVVLSEMS